MDGHIPEELITQIRGSQDIVEAISRHISLKKTGQNYIGLCPFHSEKTPSFVVSPVKQLFHCFGCGTGGNVITFLMRYENIPFPEAVKRLAQDAGIELLDRPGKGENREQYLYEINRVAATYYHKVLSTAKEAEPARKYLSGRGLSMESVKRFNIGYSINSWNAINEHLKKEGVKEELLLKSGIVVPNNSGTGYYDRFRGRIMFPICDIQKRVVGFGGRVLDDTTPKYLNSPETPIFSKGHLLYGLDTAKDSIRDTGYTIIVEGYMDVIAAHEAGVSNVVGTLGTAFTVKHLRMLNRLCKEVVLTFDSDPAGINAALRAMDIFIGSEVKARVLLLPDGEDPDSFIRKNGKTAFFELVQKAKSLVNFAIDRIIDRVGVVGTENSDSIDTRVRSAEECFTIIRKIPNRIEQDYYLKKVSQGLGIEKDILTTELKRGKKEGKKRVHTEKGKSSAVDKPKAEEILLCLIIKDWGLRKMVGDVLCVDDFADPQFHEIAGYLLESDKNIHDILNSEVCSQGVKDIMTKMAVTDIPFDAPEKSLSDCVRVLQRNRLERELKQVEREIASAELGGPFEKVTDLLKMKQGLLQKKKVLYEN